MTPRCIDPHHLLSEMLRAVTRPGSRAGSSTVRIGQTVDIRILTDVGAVDHEDDRVAAGVVALP